MNTINIYAIIDFFVTCLETLFLIYLLRNEQMRGRRIRQVFFFIFYVILIVFMTREEFNIILKFFLVALFAVCGGWVIYKCNVFRLVVYSIINIFSASISEQIVILIWTLVNGQTFPSSNVIYDEFVLSLVVSAKAFHFFIIMIFEKIMSGNKEERKIEEIVPIMVSGVSFLLVLECLSVNMVFITEYYFKVLSICSSVAILFAFVFNVIFINHYSNVRKKQHLEAAELHKLHLKYEYFQKKMQVEDSIRNIYHDLKNHFLIVKDLELSKELKEELEAYDSYYKTGNEFLDIVISDKWQKAKNKRIKMECNVDFKEGDFIEPLDISTIFGNILDNAIEASEKVSEDERYIFLTVTIKAGYLVIAVKNGMISQKYTDTKNMTTNKSNVSVHGLGLVNVKKAVGQYHGEYSINTNQHEFAITIILPIPKI